MLRGNLSAAQYEGVVLGLIFLKYISDRFEARYQELSQDEYTPTVAEHRMGGVRV